MLLLVWVVLVFALGAVVGSFLNVCIYRLPYEKSVFWPGSRCGQRLQPVRWYDNLPLVSFWLRRGRCRTCGARFSVRYFLIELLTGLGFAGLFYLEIDRNVLKIDLIHQHRFAIEWGVVPLLAWLLWFHHALLFCFLIVASFIDIDHQEIPLPVTVSGTVVGLIGGALLWPWLPAQVANLGVPLWNLKFESGVYVWPMWTVLPAWLGPRSVLAGLAAGLAGVVAGMLVLRGIGFLFRVGRGREGMGLGDADLMMMVGAFIGWQPVIVAFFVAVIPGLAFGIMQLIVRRKQQFPYGPSLAIGSLATLLGWHWIVREYPLQLLFFDGTVLLMLTVFGVVALLVTTLLLRLVMGPVPPEQKQLK